MKKKTRSRNLEVARYMPPLRHTIPGQDFDIRKSEVVQWLLKQPEVLNYIWNNIKNSEEVTYNSETGKWHGVNYQETCPHGYMDWDECPDCRH